ncbi:MAG: thioredoxin family protein [Burkholderiales bacterium]
MSPTLHRLRRRFVGIVVSGVLALLGTAAHAVGIPPAYTPLVVEPAVSAGRSEFDLGPALARAKRENKRLYVYLGASDCPYCRRYENFLGKNADELLPHFKPWIVVDLRSSLSTLANQLFIRVGNSSLNYTDFQRSIGDQRTRMLVYPSVWLFDPQFKPLMQMPAGTGTFETVEEQLEILNLVQ